MENLPISLPYLLPLAAVLGGFVVLASVGRVPIRYNLRNLAVRWPITALTALAFIVVVGLLTVMLGFVNGMYKLTQGSGRAGNVIVLSDGATEELFSTLAFGDATDVVNKIDPKLRPKLLRDDRNQVLLSKEVYVVGNQPIPSAPKERPRRRFIQLRGIEDPLIAARVHGIDLLGGAWFSEAGVQELPATSGGKTGETAIQVVLGEGIAKELGPDQGKENLHVGDIFAFGPSQEAGDVAVRKWVVVGIMKSAGSTFSSELWAKQSLIGKIFGKDNYTSLVLGTTDDDSAAMVANDIRENAKLQAMPEKEYFQKLSETNAQFLYSIGFVAIFMAAGGVFGVMNTMFAAISQRTKDIAVLRILGFTRGQIVVSFFFESLGIALLGGLLGCALGLLADGRTATSIVSSSGGGGGKSVVLKLVVDGNILAVGIVLSMLMGALGGLLPSLTAMRLRPLESLR